MGLFGQTPGKPSHRAQWDGDKLILLGEGAVPIRVVSRDSTGQPFELMITPPVGCYHLDYKDGEFTAITRSVAKGEVAKGGGDAQNKVTYTFWERGSRGWSEAAHMTFSTRYDGGFFQAFRLGNGDFLAYSDWALFRRNEGDLPAPLAILRPKSNGTMEIRSTMDFGLKQPYWTKKIGDSYGKQVETWSLTYPALWIMESFRVDGYIVLQATQPGMFFVFDDETAKLARWGQLYAVPEERLMKADLRPVSLGAAARKDGRILLASRSEDVFLHGHARLQDRLKKTRDPNDFLKFLEWNTSAEEVGYSEDPRVLWHSFDPETATFQTEFPPQNFPDKLTSIAEYRSFNWRFNLDGNLEVTKSPVEETLEARKARQERDSREAREKSAAAAPAIQSHSK